MENLKLIKAIKSLPDFFNIYLKGKAKMEDSSALSCIKKIEKGQEYWAFFCALINYQIKVKKFLVPMLDSIILKLNNECNSDFLKFLYASNEEQKKLLEEFEWKYLSKKGMYVQRTGWSHRLKKIEDLLCILNKLKNYHKNYNSLKKNTEKIYNNTNSFESFLSNFIDSFSNLDLCGFCLKCKDKEEKIEMTKSQFGKSKIRIGSCFKRYLLFFRWMVGKAPDLGLWNFIPSSELLIPLDSILQRIMARLGIIEKEEKCKWNYVKIISNFLKKVDPNDPIYYDLAISRLGILEICFKEIEKCKCDICPLNEFCKIGEKKKYITFKTS